MKWNAWPSRKALTTGPQCRPSGQIDQMPHMRSSRRPCVSSVLNSRRPSRSGVGCSALPMFIGAICVTFAPSSSMTKSCRVGLVSPFGGTKPLRLLVNATLPPATGAGPRFRMP